VVAVPEAELGGIGPTPDPSVADALDKEWLYVDQRTGELYVTYTRFGNDGSTPIELVRSFDGGRTWTPPSIIVPNLDDTFNQATQPIVTRTGRVIVTWLSTSRDDGATWGAPVKVNNDDGRTTHVFPSVQVNRRDGVGRWAIPYGDLRAADLQSGPAPRAKLPACVGGDPGHALLDRPRARGRRGGRRG
jgi:hypothetical protein